MEVTEKLPPALEHEDITTAHTNAAVSPANRVSG
jgi:hypothetical protein